MGLEGGGVHLFEKFGRRLIVGAHPAFFHDDLDFLGVFGWVDIQVAHAISFELHHFFQLLFRYLLEIGRVVAAGKGIVTPACGSDALVEFAGADRRRTLEHHVFQHVSDARGAIDFVNAADAVPDHLDGRRSAAVFLHNDAQAIFQRGLVRVGVCCGEQPRGQQKRD